MLGTLSIKEIEEVLTNHYVGHIGCHAEDVTYVVPVSYAYDGEYIYGHSEEGMKITIMRKNPNVCFQLEHMSDMANWKSVIAWGRFEELSNPLDRQKALHLLLNRRMPHISSRTVHLSPHWPFVPEDKSEIKGVVYRIKLTEKTGRFEKIEERDHSLPE